MRKNPPLLRRSILGNRVYVITRYTRRANGTIVASEKYDVTADFEQIQCERDMPGDALAIGHEDD